MSSSKSWQTPHGMAVVVVARGEMSSYTHLFRLHLAPILPLCKNHTKRERKRFRPDEQVKQSRADAWRTPNAWDSLYLWMAAPTPARGGGWFSRGSCEEAGLFVGVDDDDDTHLLGTLATYLFCAYSVRCELEMSFWFSTPWEKKENKLVCLMFLLRLAMGKKSQHQS